VVVGGSGPRRTLRIAAALGDACNLRGDLDAIQRSIDVLHVHCADLGRDPDEVAITVLDFPVVGSDRSEVAELVERHRGRTAAATFAERYPTGTAADLSDRYRHLVGLGVSTVFVAPFGSGGPADVERFAPVISAFA
jgi:alkanesulfonate monooxygenase SsuD/methylene tetrahydromethanopterin reductase-like flavin-dependent oxidoreductase (luciferase family)